MYTFPQLIKKIRNEAGLTQAQFAGILDVSTILISMIETGQKEVSKKFLLKLSEKMNVHPASITPFLFILNDVKKNPLGETEKTLLEFAEKMQHILIKNKAKKLQKYVEVNLS